MQLHDALDLIESVGWFADLFSQTDQPAEASARMALVVMLQFAGDLYNRQAADPVRGTAAIVALALGAVCYMIYGYAIVIISRVPQGMWLQL